MNIADRESTVPVTYIGRRDDWFDRLYSTGLAFDKGQTRHLPVNIARKLLRHGDLFEPATEAAALASIKDEIGKVDDDTAALLEEGKQQQDTKQQEQMETQAIYDQIERMDKQSLYDYALNNYKQKLNRSHSEVNMRAQVRQFVDQFGPV